MGSGSAWIDLATGRSVRLRLVSAGSPAEQMEWSARCATLANLRHPVINPLIDYGTAGRDHLFEAYAAHGPLHAGGGAGERLLAHAVRFLRANEIPLERPLADLALRQVEGGPAVRLRPVGVVLQRRGVFDAIADALDAARPGGACALSIEGERHSGLRTLRLAAARAARLQGYVPIAPVVLRAYPWLADRLTGRHVCVVGDEDTTRNTLEGSLLNTFGAEGGRRHLLLAFRRSVGHMRHPVRIDPMGVTAMSGMVFVDPEQGPRPEEVFAAARRAEGRPGLCLASLGAYAFEPIKTTAMVVHELPQLYEAVPGALARPVDRPVSRRTASLLKRSIDRGELLASRGRHASAHRVLSRATRVLIGRGQREEAARTALLLGRLMLDRGRLDSAIHAFEEARSACPAAPSALMATIGLGIAWTDDGRLMEAEAALRTAMVAAQSLDHRELTVQAAAALGRCLYWLGRFDEAAATLRVVGDLSPSPAAVRILATQARVHLAEGLIPAAVRAARSAVEMAALIQDARVRASACRALAAAVASAGDVHSAESHIADGLHAAAIAHLPLEAIRLRLTSADILAAAGRPEARRVVARFAAGGQFPRLLRFFARAVFARVEGMELDLPTKTFLTMSGAATIARSSISAAVNPVADLETFLELGHAAPDDRAAIERIGAELQTRLRASTVLVVAASPERRVLSVCGRPWHGDPHIAWRAAGGGVGIAVDPRIEPCQAAEPLRYSGDIIGALAARWTAGTMLDGARATSLLRVGALALAANVRAELDRAAPEPAGHMWGDLLGNSPAACALREAIARAARAPFPVLIQGESGSGKELVARGIHRLGTRRDRRFCALNCAALSDELIEAELFGHARGAFTGAVGERPGLFEDADGGTLFLDEIGELSARAQAKLLRVLQDGEVRRVGENVSRRVDVRIVAATNRRLEQEAAAGRFRADLRFRLDVVRIDVPPLRDRSGDVPLLASRFWNDAAARVGSRATLSPDAVAALARYDWPGNVRELQNVMAWMAVHSPTRGRVGPAALPGHLAHGGLPQGGTFETAREEFERRFIRAALASADGQRSRAAAALGVTRQGLAKMMRRLGLDRR